MRCAEHIGYPIFLVESLFFTEVQCCNAEKKCFCKQQIPKTKKIKNIAHNSVRFFLTDASNSKNKKSFYKKTGYLTGKGGNFNEKVCYSP